MATSVRPSHHLLCSASPILTRTMQMPPTCSPACWPLSSQRVFQKSSKCPRPRPSRSQNQDHSWPFASLVPTSSRVPCLQPSGHSAHTPGSGPGALAQAVTSVGTSFLGSPYLSSSSPLGLDSDVTCLMRASLATRLKTRLPVHPRRACPLPSRSFRFGPHHHTTDRAFCLLIAFASIYPHWTLAAVSAPVSAGPQRPCMPYRRRSTNMC